MGFRALQGRKHDIAGFQRHMALARISLAFGASGRNITDNFETGQPEIAVLYFSEFLCERT